MIPLSYIVVTLSALAFVGSGFALISGRESERRLRDRIKATQTLAVERSPADRDVLIEVAAKRNFFFQGLMFLGYRPDLPSPYSASLKVVGILVLVTFLGVSKIANALLPVGLSVPIAACVGLLTASVLFRRKSRKYRRALFQQIPDTMSLMLRAVRAGLPVSEAIRSVGRESMSPTREEFNRVAGEAALGMPIDVTLQRLYRRTQIQEYAFFSVVIGLHGQTGGNLSETLENLADMVRRRVAMAGKARALSAEGRLSALVVGVLPFVVGLFIVVVNPDYMDEFVSNVNGRALIAVFAILLSLGLLTSHLLIQRSTQD